MLTARQKDLLKALIDRESIAISELNGLGFSTATFYKYLDRLEALRVRNTRGVLRLTAEADLAPRTSIARRVRVNQPLKLGVARYIVARLARRQAQGESCGPIYLDCGSACAEIGREIADRRAPDCPIITINPLVFQHFASAPDFGNLTVISGEVDWNKGSILASVQAIEEAVFDTAIIGTDLVFADATLGQASSAGIELKRAAIAKSRDVFFPVDQSKLRARGEPARPHPFELDSARGCVVVGIDQQCPPDVLSLLAELKRSVADKKLEVVTVTSTGCPVDFPAAPRARVRPRGSSRAPAGKKPLPVDPTRDSTREATHSGSA